jgi:hypothetical protein
MENVGEVLEDVVFVQKSTKSDLQSLDTELIQLRKTLYLEVDLLKEGQNSMQLNYSTLEKVSSVKEDPSIVGIYICIYIYIYMCIYTYIYVYIYM